MNIEKIFSLSFKIFKHTVRSILSIIILYSISLLFITIDIQIFVNSISDNSSPEEVLELIPIKNVLIGVLIQLLYFILITQFIFHKINKTKVKFNLKLISQSIVKIIGLSILILILPIFIITIFIVINPGASFLFGIIPFLIFVTIFSPYLIISQSENTMLSIFKSYMIVTNNLSAIIILIMINVAFWYLLQIATSIGQILSPLIGVIVANILNYLFSIFNIQFYFLLKTKYK